MVELIDGNLSIAEGAGECLCDACKSQKLLRLLRLRNDFGRKIFVDHRQPQMKEAVGWLGSLGNSRLTLALNASRSCRLFKQQAVQAASSGRLMSTQHCESAFGLRGRRPCKPLGILVLARRMLPRPRQYLRELSLPAPVSLSPPVRPANPRVAAALDLAHAELRAGHYDRAAIVARLVRSRAPAEPEPQRLLSLLGPSLEGKSGVTAQNSVRL